jgi:type IV secretion system protein VirB9
MKRILFSCVLTAGTLLSQEARTVQVSERDVVSINARLRFTTVIVLPKEEQILDFVCGDKEFWPVQGTQNFAFVKPAKKDSSTNLNLITASGNVYSFSLTEGTGTPDLKVFIEPKDGALLAMNGAPRFVAASALDDYRSQVELARVQVAQVRKDAAEEVRAEKAKFEAENVRLKVEAPHTMQFAYTYKDQPGFNVSAMYHDGKFTYIKASPQEVPALYEVKDDKPNLVEFRYDNGLYVVSKVLDRGWLKIGKRTLHFELKAL